MCPCYIVSLLQCILQDFILVTFYTCYSLPCLMQELIGVRLVMTATRMQTASQDSSDTPVTVELDTRLEARTLQALLSL